MKLFAELKVTVTATKNEFRETSQARWYGSLLTFWDL